MVTEVLNPTVGLVVPGSLLGDHTCFFFNDSPVLIAVNMFLEPGTELHITHVIQENINDRPSPATHLWSRHHFTKLQGKTGWLQSVGHECTCGNCNDSNSPDGFGGPTLLPAVRAIASFPSENFNYSLFFFATEGRIPSSQPQEDTNPWWNPRSGAWKGCWIFYRVQMSYFCKNGRAEELCPKPVRELLKCQCSPGHCDPVCWVPFPSWEGVCGAAVHKGGYIFSLRERGRFSRAQHLLLLVNPLVSAAFRDQTPY